MYRAKTILRYGLWSFAACACAARRDYVLGYTMGKSMAELFLNPREVVVFGVTCVLVFSIFALALRRQVAVYATIAFILSICVYSSFFGVVRNYAFGLGVKDVLVANQRDCNRMIELLSTPPAVKRDSLKYAGYDFEAMVGVSEGIRSHFFSSTSGRWKMPIPMRGGWYQNWGFFRMEGNHSKLKVAVIPSTIDKDMALSGLTTGLKSYTDIDRRFVRSVDVAGLRIVWEDLAK